MEISFLDKKEFIQKHIGTPQKYRQFIKDIKLTDSENDVLQKGIHSLKQVKSNEAVVEEACEVLKTKLKEKSKTRNSKLMPCPDCGEFISKRAKTCPNCGVELTKINTSEKLDKQPSNDLNRPVKPFEAISAILVLAVFFFWLVSDSGSKNRDESRQKETRTAKNLSAASSVMCNRFVEDKLKSPSFADFSMFDYNAVDVGSNTYIVKSYVDSQNGFGATVRTNFYCKVQYKGYGSTSDRSNWKLIGIELK